LRSAGILFGSDSNNTGRWHGKTPHYRIALNDGSESFLFFDKKDRKNIGKSTGKT